MTDKPNPAPLTTQTPKPAESAVNGDAEPVLLPQRDTQKLLDAMGIDRGRSICGV
jgi:hypothetical protein